MNNLWFRDCLVLEVFLDGVLVVGEELDCEDTDHCLLVLVECLDLSGLLRVFGSLPLEDVKMLDEVVEDPEGRGHDGAWEEKLDLVEGLGVFPLSVAVHPDPGVGRVH